MIDPKSPSYKADYNGVSAQDAVAIPIPHYPLVKQAFFTFLSSFCQYMILPDAGKGSMLSRKR
ncbi:MAG: hypothetical protein J7J91_02330 [Deltaproteobacteria bacterium]|nr:hypothetical protein [Deltaproteobacteria bacterium]